MNKNLRILTLILIVSAFFTASGQNTGNSTDNLMPEVKTAFLKKYPSTSEVKWTKIDKTILISFKSGTEYYDAFYDEKGNWLRTETSILFDQLPQPVRDSLKTGEFSTWEKGSVYRVEIAGTSEIYKIYLYSKDWNELEVRYDKSGKRII